MLCTRLLRQPACQLLSQSSKKSPTPICGIPKRAFHASTPRRNQWLDAVVYLPHEMMSLIHTAVPWYAAIPLAAFVTRGVLVTTGGAWARSLTARYIGLHPLRQVLALQKRDEIWRKGGFRHPKEAMLEVKREVKNITRRLDNRWNVTLSGQISWTFAQIPIFFTMVEAVRQKCGARAGLIGLAFSPFKSDDEGLADSDVADTTSRFFDPSLATEGFLWFPDLLLPDPTGVLPFVVSALMFGNIYFTKNTVNNSANWPTLFRRFFLGLSLLIGPLMQDLPAALLLYWVSSTSSVILWNFWLDWKYPAPNGFLACKRPLQIPPTPAINRRRP